MKALIVLAHPEPASLNAALTHVAVQTLRETGQGVEVSDLCAQGFHAVAGRDDFVHLRNPERLGYVHEQRHAAATRAYAPDILVEQDKLAAADLVIFQFPLWWYGVPAILKGWADRVLTHGFAYTDERLFERGLLAGKQAMLSITTGGTEEELEADSQHTGTVEQFLKPFGGGVLGFVGMTVLPPFIAYAAGSRDTAGRAALLAAWRERLLLVVQQMPGDTSGPGGTP
ncbi:MAG TPA: NAD(P)H-dependent oxidoreductase [Ideonella sp.]|nr:NAD(P)H-dependent oxidoreductase [Ideonella sp.]